MSLEEYIREFEYLMLRCDIKEPEEHTIARFLGGLKKEFIDAIRLLSYWSFNYVRKLAITIEQERGKYSPKIAPKVSSNQRNVASSSNKPFEKGSTSRKNEVKNGGMVKNPSRTSNYARKGYRCQGYGHIASDCPNRRVVTIIEEVIEEEDGEN